MRPTPSTVESPHRSQICAVIVTYNIGEAIHRCFNSICGQAGHVLIVDNASGEATRRELNKLGSSNAVTLIFNERNEGVAHAYNQAVQWTQAQGFQWILTLDHDSEATPGMVDKLAGTYATLERQGIQNVGVVGANPIDQNTGIFSTGVHPGASENAPVEDTDVISSGSLIPLRVFDLVGPFNEDLFMYYVDTDFCRRLLQAGFRVFICPDAVLLHQEGSKRRRRFLWMHANYDHYGKTARYYLTRNTIHVIKKLPLSRTDIHLLIRRLCKDHLKILLFDKERLPVLWFSLKGLADGLRGRVGPLNSGN
jgi:rhamnosyltransferase